MALAHSPSIVTSGLVFCLDAANPKSYPGSGTTWTDLSGNGNNGTLTNGPTYSSANGGSLVFDGIDDYGTTAFSLKSSYYLWSISIWFKSNTFSNFQFLLGGNSGVGFTEYIQVYTSGTISVGSKNSSNQTTNVSYSGLNLNTWYNVVGTLNWDAQEIKLYLNGNLVNDVPVGSFGTKRTDTTFTSFGRRPDGSVGSYFDGNIAQVSIYNRALTALEIQQNYNALKGRFQ